MSGDATEALDDRSRLIGGLRAALAASLPEAAGRRGVVDAAEAGPADVAG